MGNIICRWGIVYIKAVPITQFDLALKKASVVPASGKKGNYKCDVTIEWALVVPWITRENILLMFLTTSPKGM
jgi:hypothetical protein